MVRMWPAAGRRRARAPRSAARRIWDGLLAAAILGLFALLAARLNHAGTQVLDGRVSVNDGNSLALAGERIRLLGIDAPEFDQTCRKAGEDYPCGRRSREALAALIGSRSVSCSAQGRDRYNRLLATCTAGSDELNRRQVEAGWAVAYGGYESEERAAREKAAGIWAGSFERPQRWRELRGSPAETEHVLPGVLDWLRRILRFS